MRIGREARRAAKTLFRACCVDGRLDAGRVRAAVRGLVERKPRHHGAMLARLHKLVSLDVARHRARVETAVPLDARAREAVAAAVNRRGGSAVGIEFAVDAGLIGGTRIQIGSDVWDSSVRGRLRELEARL